MGKGVFRKLLLRSLPSVPLRPAPLLNGEEVYKDILLIVIAGYEAITFFFAEPLNGACELHGAKNFYKKFT
jgi:hypothetical protein